MIHRYLVVQANLMLNTEDILEDATTLFAPNSGHRAAVANRRKACVLVRDIHFKFRLPEYSAVANMMCAVA
jgi:hypothetical protein